MALVLHQGHELIKTTITENEMKAAPPKAEHQAQAVQGSSTDSRFASAGFVHQLGKLGQDLARRVAEPPEPYVPRSLSHAPAAHRGILGVHRTTPAQMAQVASRSGVSQFDGGEPGHGAAASPERGC